MNTATIKQQLHGYLEIADDKKLKAIYTMVEDDIKETIVEYSDQFKADLDKRVEHYLKGGKMVSPNEMNKRLQAIRKKEKITMAYKYKFDPIAAAEYEEAFNWYEEKSVVAADGLIVAVQDAITAICSNPQRYRNTYKKLREVTLKKYPYNLIYYTDETKKLITITSLYHHKRHPKGKYSKAK